MLPPAAKGRPDQNPLALRVQHLAVSEAVEGREVHLASGSERLGLSGFDGAARVSAARN